MKIEHVALYVNDLEKARDFFVKYLGARSNDGYHNPQKNFRSYFLSFDDGARLELMNKPEMHCPHGLCAYRFQRGKHGKGGRPDRGAESRRL